MLLNFKVISLVLTIIAGSTYAFIVPHTAADSPAVYQTRMVFGHDVTGIVFDVNDTDPAVVDTITFHIAPSHGSAKASHVEIQTETDGTWTECSLVDDVLPTSVAICTFGTLAAEDVTALNIVAR
jgi:hypothetical protein